MTLSLNTRAVRGVHVIDMAGRLSAGEAASAFRQTLISLSLVKGNKIVLNLNEISYIDSAGLEEIILLYRTLKESGGAVTLLKPTPRVRNLLDISKLSEMLGTHDDEAEAILGVAPDAT